MNPPFTHRQQTIHFTPQSLLPKQIWNHWKRHPLWSPYRLLTVLLTLTGMTPHNSTSSKKMPFSLRSLLLHLHATGPHHPSQRLHFAPGCLPPLLRNCSEHRLSGLHSMTKLSYPRLQTDMRYQHQENHLDSRSLHLWTRLTFTRLLTLRHYQLTIFLPDEALETGSPLIGFLRTLLYQWMEGGSKAEDKNLPQAFTT